MNKIFITAGAGFIGTNFIYHCLNKNDVVLNYDLLTYAGNLNNFKNIEKNENYIFVEGDICDKEFLDGEKCLKILLFGQFFNVLCRSVGYILSSFCIYRKFNISTIWFVK